MTLSFLHSFQSEWLKKKRSLSSWLVIIGAFFTPLIIIIYRLVHYKQLATMYASDEFWNKLWQNSWETMALFLLPVGVILATSLITQLEYKNNTWKQLHTTPLSFTTVFFSKIAIIIVMVFQFFLLFNIGIYLTALVPYLLVAGVPYPQAPIPFAALIRENFLFFVDCLPIIALQYLLSLQFKNFIIPIGIGFGLWIASISTLSWKFGYTIPYIYTMLNFLKTQQGARIAVMPVNIHVLSFVYFIVITIVSYLLYITKKEKG
jgi:lantibiotic transport system permease protein